jgi:hypothetical protein
MDYRLARDPGTMDLSELEVLIRTRTALASAHHAAATAARAVREAPANDPARERGRAEARRAWLRVAELEQKMIAHGWWAEEQRTLLLTDDGLVVMRDPTGAGLT